MKRWAYVIGLVAGFLAASARAEVESLVQGGYWAAWIRPEAKVTTIDEDTAGIGGVQVGTALSRALYVGVGYNALLGSVHFGEPETGEIGGFDLWYTGVAVNYTVLAEKLLHGALDVFVGGGSVDAEMTGGTSEQATLFVAEPGANLMVNVTPGVELGLGLGYRIASGSDIDGLSDSDLGGLTGSLFLRCTEQR